MGAPQFWPSQTRVKETCQALLCPRHSLVASDRKLAAKVGSTAEKVAKQIHNAGSGFALSMTNCTGGTAAAAAAAAAAALCSAAVVGGCAEELVVLRNTLELQDHKPLSETFLKVSMSRAEVLASSPECPKTLLRIVCPSHDRRNCLCLDTASSACQGQLFLSRRLWECQHDQSTTSCCCRLCVGSASGWRCLSARKLRLKTEECGVCGWRCHSAVLMPWSRVEDSSHLSAAAFAAISTSRWCLDVLSAAALRTLPCH